MGCFKDGGLKSVALAEAVGNVKAGFAAEHLDGGFEKDDGGGAVDVVVAVEEDGFFVADGALKAFDGGGHAEHEKGIVEVSDFWIQECVCGGRFRDAAGNEQFGEHWGQAGFFGEGFGGGTVGFSDQPALGRERARCRRLCCTGTDAWAGHGRLLVLVVVGMPVLNHDVLEALDVLKQGLESLVPLGGGFVEKYDALVDEA